MNSGFNQHYDAPKVTREFAKALRKPLTAAEERLWFYLRNRKTLGLKFRRQQPIDKYIADFYCHDLKLVIELDGDVHLTDKQKEHDIIRNQTMSWLGITVLRFSNDVVFYNPEIIDFEISKIIELRTVGK